MFKTNFYLLVTLSVTLSFSQDKIYKTNSGVIDCKITEILDNEIKYTQPDFDVVFGISKNKITKVVFENGKTLDFENELYVKEPDYATQNRNIIKFNLLSPTSDYIEFSYENSIRKGRSIEATFGITGIGVTTHSSNPSGFSFKFGYKLIRSPNYYIKGMKYAHLLKGGYIKPELVFSHFKADSYYNYMSNDTKRKSFTNGALMVNLGKQFIFDNTISVDIYIGFGYGIGTDDYTDDNYYSNVDNRRFSFMFMDSFAMQSGLKIGYLF